MRMIVTTDLDDNTASQQEMNRYEDSVHAIKRNS